MKRDSSRAQTATVDIKIRMKEPLRAQIEEAARRRGISMNSEMNVRLERSFQRQDLLHEVLELAYGRELAGVLLTIAIAMRIAGRQAGFIASGGAFAGAENWLSDPFAYAQAAEAAAHVLAALKPAGDPEQTIARQPSKDAQDVARGLGNSTAFYVLRAIKEAEQRAASLPPEHRQLTGDARLYAMLGPLVERIPDAPPEKTEKPQ